MASAGNNATIGTTAVKIFDQAADNGKVSDFAVAVRSTASNPALVNIPGLHKTGEYFGIPVGGAIIFTLRDDGISKVYVKGDGGNTLIDFGVVGRGIAR